MFCFVTACDVSFGSIPFLLPSVWLMTRVYFSLLDVDGDGHQLGAACVLVAVRCLTAEDGAPLEEIGRREQKKKKKKEKTRCGERAVKLLLSLGKRGKLHQQLVELIIRNLVLFPQTGNDRLGLLRLGSVGVRAPTVAGSGDSPTARGVAGHSASVHHHTLSVQWHHQATRG